MQKLAVGHEEHGGQALLVAGSRPHLPTSACIFLKREREKSTSSLVLKSTREKWCQMRKFRLKFLVSWCQQYRFLTFQNPVLCPYSPDMKMWVCFLHFKSVDKHKWSINRTFFFGFFFFWNFIAFISLTFASKSIQQSLTEGDHERGCCKGFLL